MTLKYYRITFKLASSMMIGSGCNDHSDSDLLRDVEGIPFIPGSSLTGVYRDLLPDRSVREKYFGEIKFKSETKKDIESAIVVYDAYPDKPEDMVTTIRDNVKLDDFKTAVPGAKFDYEVLEPGCTFTTYLEQTITDDREQDVISDIVKTWVVNGLRFGAKTRRGLGKTEICKDGEGLLIREASFDLDKEDSLESWLAFDMYRKDDPHWIAYKNSGKVLSGNYIGLCLGLQLVSGISVRKYSPIPPALPKDDDTNNGTDLREKDDEKREPDYEQLCYLSNNQPFVPGTAWAGIFSHHLKSLGMTDAQVEDLFGSVKHNNGMASKITFDDSKLVGSKEKISTRNAIDRFTGGTKEHALYTERFFYGGHTELNIRIEKDKVDTVQNVLAAMLTDFHFGLAAVGGLTSIGRGLFKITSINGVDFNEKENEAETADELFTKLKSCLTKEALLSKEDTEAEE